MPTPSLNEYSGELLTVATWNIMTAPVSVLDRMSEAAAWLEDVDVLCVQEAVHTEPSEMGTAQILAHNLGMHVVSDTFQEGISYGRKVSWGTAILARLPVLTQNYIDLTPAGGNQSDASLALFETPNGYPLYVVSAHLEWGGTKEPARLTQAVLIEQEMKNRAKEYQQAHGVEPLIVMGIDANALPESDTLRYLTGLHAPAGISESALWVDAWKTAGDGDGFTSVIEGNEHGIMTAKSMNTRNPLMTPSRRIDYLLVRDWVYGKPGMPVNAELRGTTSKLGKTLASDHYAVIAHLWDPR